MGYRNYATAKGHIVDATGHGDFTTIGAALTAASSGQTIFIRPGTYTENLTLKAGVGLTAFECDPFNPNVTIVGKCSFTAAGNASLSSVTLETNSDYCVAVTGSANSVLYLNNCLIDANNHTAINYTSSGSASGINCYTCEGSIDTTGIAYFTHSSAGILNFIDCWFGNQGLSTTSSTISSGTVRLYNTTFPNAITSSSTGDISIHFSTMDLNLLNTTPLTHGGDSGSNINFSQFAGGTAPALTVSTSLLTRSCDYNSTNTNAISGAGTVNIQLATFSGSSSTIQPTVVNANAYIGHLTHS